MTSSSQQLQGIAQVLVLEQMLDREQAIRAQAEAKKLNQRLVQYLVSNRILSAYEIALMGAKDFGVPMLDLQHFDKDLIPLELVNIKLIHRHHSLPLLKRGDNLFIAVDDPSDQHSMKEIQFHTGLNTQAIIVETNQLSQLIDDISNKKENEALGDYLDDSGDLDALEISSEEDEEQEQTGEASDDAPIVRFVQKILVDSIKKGASDIHFEPYEQKFRIRFRIDGLLHEMASPPTSLSNRIIARIKIISNLDISERRIPQDGRFKLKLSSKRAIDFRVSTCPTVNGEKIVMRILDPSATHLGIEVLGFSELQKQLFSENINKPHGMILVTGPTGSGKTVTLYTALNILNTIDRNISTAEDPVEIKLPGINQVNIYPKVGLSFSSTLRAFLRQDPDIIMVGEMRDLETAEIGIKAAQTGHLVLSTLHTNSAPETLTRLTNMGISAFNIASSVSLIIAQRLARKLCESCREVNDSITPKMLTELGFKTKELDKIKIYRAVGCEFCNAGYKGRVGLFEVLEMNKAIEKLIMQGESSLSIESQAKKNGMLTIRDSGLIKVSEGLISLEELNRVSKI